MLDTSQDKIDYLKPEIIFQIEINNLKKLPPN